MAKKAASSFGSLKDQGNHEFKAKNYEKAKELYTKAIKSSQDLALVYSNRAQCNLNLGHFYDALNDCNIALRIDPSMTKCHYRRAVALENLYRYRLALEDYERVLEVDVNNEIAKKHIASIKKLFDSNARVEMKLIEKPEIYRSKEPFKSVQIDY